MDKIESNLGFRLMALSFKFHDFFRPRIDILKEVGIKPGYHVLDYGCGSGSSTEAPKHLIPIHHIFKIQSCHVKNVTSAREINAPLRTLNRVISREIISRNACATVFTS
jgi:trans-aconitate methyltransferase